MAGRDSRANEPPSTCPQCGTEMGVTRVKPLLFGGKFEELTLACKGCGFTRGITIERS
jgi:C4-type Zn-finger protein